MMEKKKSNVNVVSFIIEGKKKLEENNLNAPNLGSG